MVDVSCVLSDQHDSWANHWCRWGVPSTYFKVSKTNQIEVKGSKKPLWFWKTNGERKRNLLQKASKFSPDLISALQGEYFCCISESRQKHYIYAAKSRSGGDPVRLNGNLD